MTQNTDLIQTLNMIGLGENEAKVYLACLELGPSSIWDIAQKCGVKRPTCYVVLDDLLSMGYASKTNDNKRTIYSVVNPRELLAAFDQRKKQFSQSLAQFDALSSKSAQKPKIRLYEGAHGVEQVFNLVLNQPEGSELLIIGTNMIETAYSEYFKIFIAERAKKKIFARAIFENNKPNRELASNDDPELRETRLVPGPEFDPRTITFIFGDSIANIAHSESNPFATVIESSALAYDERQRFNLLWEIAKKPKEIR